MKLKCLFYGQNVSLNPYTAFDFEVVSRVVFQRWSMNIFTTVYLCQHRWYYPKGPMSSLDFYKIGIVYSEILI